MQAKEKLKLWVLGGGLVVIATFCARSIIPLGEEIVSGPASAGDAGNHEWLICIGVAFIFIVLARKSRNVMMKDMTKMITVKNNKFVYNSSCDKSCEISLRRVFS